MPVLFAGREFKTLTKRADAQPEIFRFLVGRTGIDGGPAFGTERKIAPIATVSDLRIDRRRAGCETECTLDRRHDDAKR